jgi:hypothetical protein
LVEEAHRFCPERGVGTAMSLPILRTVAAEGRKFGMGLGIVTQRPAKVDKNVLSQSNTQIILKVTNPNDIMAISKSLENFTPELEDVMKNLPMGVALITSENLERPVLTNIRVRRSKHGGTAVDLIKTRQPGPGGSMPKIPTLGNKIEIDKGVVGMLKKKLIGTEKEVRQEKAHTAVERMVEQKQDDIKREAELNEWKENLTPDEIEFIEEHKEPGIGKKILFGVKRFFIEDKIE